MSKDSTLYIVEPVASGHRMAYVRRIVREAVRQGIDTVVVTLEDSLHHKSYQLMVEELKGEFSVELLQIDSLVSWLLSSTSNACTQLGWFLAFRSFFAKKEPHVREKAIVFVPQLDYCDKIIGFLGSPFLTIPWSGLVMQYKFHYQKMGAVRTPEPGDASKERALKLLLRNRLLRKLFVIDELLMNYGSQTFPELAKKLEYVADPVDMVGTISTEDARKIFGIPPGKKVVLLFGALHLRKGVAQLLSGAVLSNFPQDVVLLLAGKQGDDLAPLMSGKNAALLRTKGALIEINRYLDDDEEFAAFKAANIVWVGYREFYGMSGVLIQAGKAGLPVIACREGLIGWMTRNYELGLAIDIDATEQIAMAVASLFKDEERSLYFGQQGERLAKKHSGIEFAKSIVRSLATD